MSPSSRPASRPASDRVLLAAREIRALPAGRPLESACAVGRIVLARLYGGDVRAWRSRSRKAASLRRLADRLQGVRARGVASLTRCVAVHVALRAFGGVATWQHLQPSHVRLVAGLRVADQQEILRAAEAGRWTVVRLAGEVAKRKAPRGRRADPGRAAERLGGLALDPRLDGFDARSVPPQEVARLCATLAVLRNRCDELHRALATRRDELSRARRAR